MNPGRTKQGTAFEVHGPQAPNVILVHGLGLNKTMWQLQVPALVAAGWQVVTYDLYGHGESAAPPQVPTLALFSGQLAGLMEHLGITRAVVAGFSLGGMIARRFAMDHPDCTTALALLHSAHLRDQAAHDAIQARVHQARQDGPGATVEAALERWFTAPFREAHPEIMDLVRKWVLANSKDIYPSIYQVLVPTGSPRLARPPCRRSPALTLVMTGDEDYGNSVEMSTRHRGRDTRRRRPSSWQRAAAHGAGRRHLKRLNAPLLRVPAHRWGRKAA
jgi:pimeloyl-ACP methyl ester carboxylesterase